jgi:hypothetical protein
VLEDTLQGTIEVTLRGRPCRMKRLDALVLTTFDGALKGDPKAVTSLMLMMRQTGSMGETAETVSEMPLSAQDKDIINDYLQRKEPPQQIPSDGRPPAGGKPKGKRKGGGK